MRRSALRRLLLGGVLIALVPAPAVQAAEIQTVVTMDPIAPIVYRGESEYFSAHASDDAPFVPDSRVEWSTDGLTWHAFPSASETGNGWKYSATVDGSVALGSRMIRAYYSGIPGSYLPAYSEPQTQEVAIRQAEITDLQVTNPEWPILLPGTAPVRVAAAGTHAINLDRLVAGAWQPIGSGWVDLPALGVGDHMFRAWIQTTDYVIGTTRRITVRVRKGATDPIWIGDRTVQANHALSVQVSINAVGAGVPMDGPMTVREVATGRVIGRGTVGLQVTIPPMNAGVHAFLVSYLGTSDYAASSKTFNVTVTNDVVQATGVGLSYSTFYPVRDSYRDTVKIKGNRVEPLSVDIRVYSPRGSLVKRTTLPRAAGAYGYAWNGRTSTGSLRAAGKYKVVQVLVDAAGTRKTFTSYVTLSHRKLVTKTAYITKLGRWVSAKGDGGPGSITISTTGGFARLTGRSPNGWVGVGYQFTLPSAAVYKSIAFQVYDKGPKAVPPSHIGLQNFTDCPYTSTGTWYEQCFDHWQGIGDWTTKWFSASGSATHNRHGRIVRGMVSVPHYTHTIYKARVKVVYRILQ